MHHDRRLHQMMLAEDCKAWDIRSGALSPGRAGPPGSLGRPASYASARLAELSSSSVCLPSHGSPTDSASSLYAECLLTQDSVGEDAGASAFRCASLSLHGERGLSYRLSAGRDHTSWPSTEYCRTLLKRFVANMRHPDQSSLLMRRSTKHSKPDVSIVRCKQTGYWLVNITCKDRNKLLFDTVSTPNFNLQYIPCQATALVSTPLPCARHLLFS